VYRAGRRLVLLRAARSYRQLLRTVFASADVRERLGDDVRKQTLARMQRYGRNHAWETAGTSGAAAAKAMVAPNLRLVSFLPQGFAYRPHRDAWARYWRSRRLHFLVYVCGSRGGALVTAEVEQSLRGEDQTTLLALELVDRGEQLVLTGRDLAKEGKRKQDLMDKQEEAVGATRGKDLLSRTVVKH